MVLAGAALTSTHTYSTKLFPEELGMRRTGDPDFALFVMVWGLQELFDTAPEVEGWRLSETMGPAPVHPDFFPDFSQEAYVPADTTFTVTSRSNRAV